MHRENKTTEKLPSSSHYCFLRIARTLNSTSSSSSSSKNLPSGDFCEVGHTPLLIFGFQLTSYPPFRDNATTKKITLSALVRSPRETQLALRTRFPGAFPSGRETNRKGSVSVSGLRGETFSPSWRFDAKLAKRRRWQGLEDFCLCARFMS